MPTPKLLRLLPLLAVAACDSGAAAPDAAVDLAVVDLPLPAEKMLAAAQTLTTCLAIDASAVYFTDQGMGNRVMKVALDGTGGATAIASGGDAPGCVTVDGANAYFTDADKVMMAPTAGGGATAIAQGQHFLGKVFAHAGYVYWITDVYGAIDAFNGKNAIVRVKAGGAVEVMFGGVLGNPGGLAVDDANLYYSDQNGVFAQPVSGAAAITFGTSSIKHNPFAVDGAGAHLAMVEIASQGTGDIAVFRLDGMGKQVVSMSLAAALAIDASGVYARQGNHLVAFALDGSTTRTLAYSPPRAIALDATSVYFTDGGSIQKVTKPK